jgi:hypothetical protein
LLRKEGYIALLDILGFEQLVSRESHVEELERYIGTITEASEHSGLEFVLFSDTIVITTSDTSEDLLKDLVRCCSRLFGRLLIEGIPLRGAVAKGSFIRNKTEAGVFLAGRAVVDAYRFEKKQNWVGILLTPSVLTNIPNLSRYCGVVGRNVSGAQLVLEASRLDWKRCVQPCDSVPFHSDTAIDPPFYEGFALVPTKSDVRTHDGILSEIEDMQKSLIRLKSLAPDPSAQKKYTSAQEWLGVVKGRWANGPDSWPGGSGN